MSGTSIRVHPHMMSILGGGGGPTKSDVEREVVLILNYNSAAEWEGLKKWQNFVDIICGWFLTAIFVVSAVAVVGGDAAGNGVQCGMDAMSGRTTLDCNAKGMIVQPPMSMISAMPALPLKKGQLASQTEYSRYRIL